MFSCRLSTERGISCFIAQGTLEGLIRRIYPSDPQFFPRIRPVPYQTGKWILKNGGCRGDQGLQTFFSKHKLCSRQQRPKAPLWAWFGHLKQSGKTRWAAKTFKTFNEEHKSSKTVRHENTEVLVCNNINWAKELKLWQFLLSWFAILTLKVV